jgi:hypothetical protein
MRPLERAVAFMPGCLMIIPLPILKNGEGRRGGVLGHTAELYEVGGVKT